MKVTWVVIFSLSYFAAIYALPARSGSDEVEFVPLEAQNGGAPIVDTGVIGGGPWLGPFDGLFESLAGMMARMRQQMDYLLRRLPIGNGTIEDGPFSAFPNLPDIDLGKGNTTSVTKVIDGHKVVINETEYKQEGANGGAFFKVRIIDVLPDSSELTTEKNAEVITTSPKDVETVEDSFENEIPKNREVFNNIETFDEPDNSAKLTTGEIVSPRKQFTKWETLEPFESVEDNSIEYRPYDLSRDIYVNQVMADAGAPTNPDAEVFTVPTRPRQPFEKITYPR